MIEFNLNEDVKVLFKDEKGNKAEITITVNQLIENSEDYFYELLDDTDSCTSASCNNESQNFCDCGSIYEDYEIYGVKL